MSRGGYRGRGGRNRYIPRSGGGEKSQNESSELIPPPLYPTLLVFSQPLLAPSDEFDYNYLLTLKQEYRAAMLESPYYLKPDVKRSEIERYSDKYQVIGQNGAQKWKPDQRRVPAELCIAVKKKTKNSEERKSKQAKRKLRAALIVDRKLIELEEREEGMDVQDDETTQKQVNVDEKAPDELEQVEEEDEEEDEEEEEEEQEENDSENDYNVNYYESGQSDADDSNDENAYY